MRWDCIEHATHLDQPLGCPLRCVLFVVYAGPLHTHTHTHAHAHATEYKLAQHRRRMEHVLATTRVQRPPPSRLGSSQGLQLWAAIAVVSRQYNGNNHVRVPRTWMISRPGKTPHVTALAWHGSAFVYSAPSALTAWYVRFGNLRRCSCNVNHGSDLAGIRTPNVVHGKAYNEVFELPGGHEELHVSLLEHVATLATPTKDGVVARHAVHPWLRVDGQEAIGVEPSEVIHDGHNFARLVHSLLTPWQLLDLACQVLVEHRLAGRTITPDNNTRVVSVVRTWTHQAPHTTYMSFSEVGTPHSFLRFTLGRLLLK